jgi:hypothetical protein
VIISRCCGRRWTTCLPSAGQPRGQQCPKAPRCLRCVTTCGQDATASQRRRPAVHDSWAADGLAPAALLLPDAEGETAAALLAVLSVTRLSVKRSYHGLPPPVRKPWIVSLPDGKMDTGETCGTDRLRPGLHH